MDTDQARTIAPYFMPKTKSKFGRASARWSHYFYYSDLTNTAGIGAAVALRDPTTKGMIAELRIGGDGKGAQTVAPGSTHEDTGEPIIWEQDGEPAHTPGDDLLKRIKIVAALALLAAHWPERGAKARHSQALRLGGFLARCGWNEQQIELAFEAITAATNDPEIWNRKEAGRDALRNFLKGKNTFGFPALREDFGEPIARKVAEWLNYFHSEAQADPETENPEDEQKPKQRLLQSSQEFSQTFEAPDPLIEGILMRKFIYALTGHVSRGKTAAALLFAAHVALGKMLGNLEVEKGRVLYLAGENYVDVQMRWIAMAQQMDFDLAAIPVYFRSGRFRLSEKMDQLRTEVEELGGVDLAIVDGSTAFFEGDDENNNAQAATHAVRLRELTTLKGEPGVLVLCHPPKNAGDDNLQPRGAGAMIAEWDGNLTATKDGTVTTVHWQLKIRGPDFAPVHLLLRTVTHERLVSSRGKLLPTVVAESLSETRQEELHKVARYEEDQVLEAINDRPHSSQADIARHLGWLSPKGEILKAKMHRITKDLKKQKLVEEGRTGLQLTEKGKKAIKADDAK